MNYYKRVILPRRLALRDYRKTPTWQEKRKLVLARDKFRCRAHNCSATTNLHVHHMRYPDVHGTEPISWLITLCEKHHADVHRLGRKSGVSLRSASLSVLTGAPPTRFYRKKKRR